MNRRSFLSALAVAPVAAASIVPAMAMGPQKFQHKALMHSVDFTYDELALKEAWCKEQILQMDDAFKQEIAEYEAQGRIVWKKAPDARAVECVHSRTVEYTWSAQFHVI